MPKSGGFESNPTDSMEKQQGCSAGLEGGTAAPMASVSCDLKARTDTGAWAVPRWSQGVLAVLCRMLGAGWGPQGTGRALERRRHLPPSMSSVQLRLLLVGELEEV